MYINISEISYLISQFIAGVVLSLLISLNYHRSLLVPITSSTLLKIEFCSNSIYYIIQWWPKLLEHLTYLRGWICLCWIGHNTRKTNYCWNYLRRKESAGTLKMMDWPSPDLNPIEQIWGELKNKLDRSIVHSKESLWLELQKAWDNISVEVLRKYINTVPERCAAVIAAKGGHTKIFCLKWIKTVWLTSSDICCAQRLCFGGKKGQYFQICHVF